MWKEQIGKNKSSYVSSVRTDTSGIVTRGNTFDHNSLLDKTKEAREKMRGFSSVNKDN